MEDPSALCQQVWRRAALFPFKMRTRTARVKENDAGVILGQEGLTLWAGYTEFQ
jgi:hypothetical protein